MESLNLLGVSPADVEDVVISHMHYDHAGNLGKLPRAAFHVQEAEMQFCCSRHMRYPTINQSYECDDIVEMVRLNFKGRVVIHSGAFELAPGITVHPVGGHSPGMQFMRIHTTRGRGALASDMTHYYDNLELGRPFPGLVDVRNVFDGYEALKIASSSPSHIVPGHDPLVMERYPAVTRALEGIAVRLDVQPK